MAYRSALQWTMDLIRYDTISDRSNLTLINPVADYLTDHGATVDLAYNADHQKANLVATFAAADGSTSGGLVLSGHTDVVPVAGQEWQTDPFEPEVRDGALFGRGSSDMKGFIAAILSFVPQLTELKLAQPLHIALSYDEEVGCLGGEAIVQQINNLGLAPRAAIIGEPSSLEVIYGHKSVNLIDVTVHGKPAHSSLPTLGVNAISYATRLITFVEQLATDFRAKGPYDEAYEIPYTTLNATTMAAGNASNIIPEFARLQFDLRTIAAHDPAHIIELIQQRVTDLESQLKAADPSCWIRQQVPSMVPGLETPPDSLPVQIALAAGGTATRRKVTYGTEAGQFVAGGIPAVVCGPGDIAQAHTPNEFIALDQLTAATNFVSNLVRGLLQPAEQTR